MTRPIFDAQSSAHSHAAPFPSFISQPRTEPTCLPYSFSPFFSPCFVSLGQPNSCAFFSSSQPICSQPHLSLSLFHLAACTLHIIFNQPSHPLPLLRPLRLLAQKPEAKRGAFCLLLPHTQNHKLPLS